MISKIDWQKCNGMLPVITQKFDTNEVLMLGYMNEEALGLTLSTKEVHYFSRTKNRIWKKGETSGHIQKVKSIFIDCDNDTLLIKVDQLGVCCHTGRDSCFFTDFQTNTEIIEVTKDMSETYGVVDRLFHIINERKNANIDESYTAKLLYGKQNSMLKKIVEEAGEFTFAIKDGDDNEIVYEAADLLYHSLVALASKSISPDRVKNELARRFHISGIAEKNSRTKE